MKHLFFLLLFSCSRAFSQVSQYAICYHNTPACMCSSGEVVIRDTAKPRIDLKAKGWIANTTPDTLRAICLITLHPNGIAHSRMGFVVICEGKRPVYLDCNKRALKLPQVGWGYELVNPNYKQK